MGLNAPEQHSKDQDPMGSYDYEGLQSTAGGRGTGLLLEITWNLLQPELC